MQSIAESSLWGRSSAAIVDAVVSNDVLRDLALKIADKRLYKGLVEDLPGQEPRRAQLEKYYLLRNLFSSLNSALSQRRVSARVRQAILKCFVGSVVLGSKERQQAFVKRNGFDPPGFLTISPGKKCNLHCTGCYAGSGSADRELLDYEVFSRIVSEKTESWGSHFTVISGGEPLVYRSRGKGVLELAEEHSDNYFLMYTNGTLIDEKVARRMAALGNITPAISVEGLEAETDARRGAGVYRRILKSFGYLRDAGVPFGISITVTRNNAELALSDTVIQRYFEEEGAIYGWIFQYMPIGREYTLDLMITPQQRVAMLRRMEHLVREKRVFLVDFWNSGPATNGCLAGGRANGYFYIDWSGNITPCVFFPYATHNVADIYREGGHLDNVLASPLFAGLRQWQDTYGYRRPPAQMQNQIVPCPMRDHHGVATDLVRSCGACGTNPDAEAALRDRAYHSGMERYGKEIAALTDPFWQEFYSGNKVEKLVQ